MRRDDVSSDEQEQDLRRRFAAILDRASVLGVTDEQLAGLESVADLQRHAAMVSQDEGASRRHRCIVTVACAALALLLVCVAGVFVFQWPVEWQSLVALGFGFER